MSQTFEHPNKAHFRSLWVSYAVFCILSLLAISVFKIQSPSIGIVVAMVGTMIIVFQNHPIIWRQGDTIVFRLPAKKTTQTEPAIAATTQH